MNEKIRRIVTVLLMSLSKLFTARDTKNENLKRKHLQTLSAMVRVAFFKFIYVYIALTFVFWKFGGTTQVLEMTANGHYPNAFFC
jgi:hypothetical protein